MAKLLYVLCLASSRLTGLFSQNSMVSSPLGSLTDLSSESAAVGISLTTSYGTASVRYVDGTIEEIARVDADEDYVKMMRRLSKWEAAHPSDPYNNLEDMWDDIPRQLWRSARKRLGFPASADVGRLSTIVHRLYEASLSHISDTHPSVVISFPAMPGLYDEDIFDAMQYLELRALRGFFFYEPRQAVAAYAGHGMGLCENYNDYDECKTQGLDLPVRETLLVEYSKASLLLHSLVLREAVDLGRHEVDVIVSFDLGSNAMDSPDYTDRVRTEVLTVLRKRYQFESPPDMITVIFTGESGGDAGIKDIVQEAIEEFGAQVSLFTAAPEFIASRGAAELAWRAQFLQLQ